MKLLLCPKWDFSEVLFPLHEVKGIGETHIRSEQLFSHTIGGRVYSDIPYSAILCLEGSEIPNQINFYLNGELIRSFCQPNENNEVKISFISDRYPRSDVFRDCYGYIKIELELIINEERSHSFVTDYIAVMLKATSVNRSVQRMAEYVYKQHERYLWKRDLLPTGYVSITQHEEKSLDALIAIIKAIVRVYEHNIAFFRTNPHSKAETTFLVSDFSKLQVVTPKTLQYIVQHPNELLPSEAKVGIEFRGQQYYPKHTLVTNTQRIRETYENRVVLGFIHEVVLQITTLVERIERYLSINPDEAKSVNGYVDSTVYILQTTRHSLKNKRVELLSLVNALTELYWTYKKYLPIDEILVTQIPMPTAVFMSSAPYRQIYDVIMQWYSYGLYDFSGEEFLLPLLINNRLYEYYALFRIAEAIENYGFTIDEENCRRHQYSVTYEKYRDTDHINTFAFRNGSDERITLYYQPVVWGTQYSDAINNGLSLRRTTSLSLSGSGHDRRLTKSVPRAFYTPDYILKYSNGIKERYIIVDAKLSTFECVKSSYVESLAYKYLFSIHPASEPSEILGLWVIYGKSVEKPSELQSVHDIFYSSSAPNFWLTSLTESDDDLMNQQNDTLVRLIRELSGKSSYDTSDSQE